MTCTVPGKCKLQSLSSLNTRLNTCKNRVSRIKSIGDRILGSMNVKQVSVKNTS